MNELFQEIATKFDFEAFKAIWLFDKRNPLLFNSGMFLLLFLGFILIYQAIRRWRYAKMIFVILFSLYFYYKSSAEYCFILLGVCVSDYLLGLWMGQAKSKALRRCIVALNVFVNIGMLVWFKYFNLLYETFASITSTNFDALDIILPAGISFFTFRSISYIVDIYRGQMQPARNFIEYTFFLTFFPPLLAGPVVRAKDMLPQIKANPIATRAMVSEGMFLIICGLIKKVIVADYISGNFVDRIFENPSLYSGFENLMGMLGFTIQIYCDFSGYSDMAIGIALLLGYRFKDNFQAPYKSQNPTEFWHRWHISLSTWLRDYVYIPLGGNRKGKFRKNTNLIFTMLVGGLWHGASWMYLIWGGYNGALLVGHKTFNKLSPVPQRFRKTTLIRATNIFFTFVLVIIGMTIFRAASLGSLGEMYTQIANDFKPQVVPQFIEAYSMIVVVMVFGFLIHFAPTKWTRGLMQGYDSIGLIAQAIVLAIVIFVIIQTKQSDLVPFIYFQY